MALLEATLKTQIDLGLTALTGEPAPDAATEQGLRWGNYFKAATHVATPVLPAGVDLGVAAMVAAMTFDNDAGDGDDVMQAGYTAFWTHLQANNLLYWPGTLPGIPPPGLSGLASALGSKFSANEDPDTTQLEAAGNLANAIHPNAGLGGTLFIALVSFPIL